MRSFLKEYLIILKFEKNLSDNTLTSYESDLNRFIDFMESKDICDPNEIKYKDLIAFFDNIKSFDTTNSTNARYMSSIRGFFHYLLGSKYIELNPAEKLPAPKLKRSLPTVLNFEEINLLLEQPDSATLLGRRDSAMLELFYSSGLRVSEMINLKINDLYFDDELIRVLGKGSKQRLVPIGSSAIKAMANYLKYSRPHLENKLKSQNIVFLNNRSTKLSRMGVWKLVNRYAKMACITKDVHPHTFRHTFATHLINGGADLRAVQEMLGHADISTTQIYTHIEKDYVKQMHHDFHPRG